MPNRESFTDQIEKNPTFIVETKNNYVKRTVNIAVFTYFLIDLNHRQVRLFILNKFHINRNELRKI